MYVYVCLADKNTVSSHYVSLDEMVAKFKSCVLGEFTKKSPMMMMMMMTQ